MKPRSPLMPVLAALLFALAVKLFVVDLALVEGQSMRPTLGEGQVVLVFRLAYGLRLPQGLGGYLVRWAEPEPRDLVVAENPLSGAPVIKRVARTLRGYEGSSEVWLLGDNPPYSLDSRSYGAVSVEKVAGRVLSFSQRP